MLMWPGLWGEGEFIIGASDLEARGRGRGRKL